ncbi:MAG: gliding motility-associated-like protein [Crocinitomix sp.]|jgi:gliding motility-associated-like protein
MKMSNIDKILKEAVEGYEAPYDAGIWDNISSQLSPMEDAFRESVKGHEAPYNPGAWSAIKNQIGSSSTLFQWIAGSAAAVTLVVGTIAFIPSDDSTLVEGPSASKIDTNSAIVFNDNKTTENKTTTNEITSIIANEVVNNDQIEENLIIAENNPDVLNNEVNDNGNTQEVNNIVDEPESNNNQGDGIIAVTPIVTPIDQSTETSVELKYSAEFSISADEVCAGEKILFNPKVVKGNAIHVWDFGDGTYSSEAAASHTFESAGNYDVTLTVRDKNTNKVLATANEAVTINGLPNIEFSWEKDNAAIPTVDFINLTEEGQNWAWKVNGRMISDKNEFEYTFREKGIYNIELSATNSDGCENQIQEQITVDSDYDLFAPNAFSPNGDGYNGTFIPKALLLMDNEFTMMIYDQPGNLVYTTQSVNEPWDGRKGDNTIAPGGSYIWVVMLKNGNGQIEEYKGQLTLIK